MAPGETVALVGETMTGKSTMVKLVSRFYDPTAGAVLKVDGIDLRQIDLGRFRRQIGIVPQEAFLFTGTLRDNIAYGRPDETDAEVEAAARAVGAHDFVAAQPGDSFLEPGQSERQDPLSAGQRQLIALARARLVDPAILLLDEATSPSSTWPAQASGVSKGHRRGWPKGAPPCRGGPPSHGPGRRRSHPGHRPGPDRRTGHPRRAVGPRRRVRPALRAAFTGAALVA